jgi:hypothetical protein
MNIKTTGAGWAAIITIIVTVMVAFGLDINISEEKILLAGGTLALVINSIGNLWSADSKPVEKKDE